MNNTHNSNETLTVEELEELRDFLIEQLNRINEKIKRRKENESTNKSI